MTFPRRNQFPEEMYHAADGKQFDRHKLAFVLDFIGHDQEMRTYVLSPNAKMKDYTTVLQ